ncbi:MAG: DUF4402 domain-containing protein [Nitrospirota bacterium]|nr:DUF4402 domain-containing protein [Nitrospirota bacterium]
MVRPGAALVGALLMLLGSVLPVHAKNHWALAVTLIQGMSFPPSEQGLTTTFIVAPLDPTAAVFDAAGQKGQTINVSVVEVSINMTTGGGTLPSEQIPVDTWTFGGSLVDVGGAGQANFTNVGTLTNMRVGASAHVTFDDVPGAYLGSATMRAVYL